MSTLMRHTVTVNPTGGHDVVSEPIAPEDKKRLDSMMGNEPSESSRRLQAMKSRRKGLVAKETIDGEDWFIKLLAWPELARIGVLTSRETDGSLDLSGDDVLRTLTAAALHVCVVKSETDHAPYFGTYTEALEWVDEPEAWELVAALFNVVTEHNSGILPGGKKKTEAPPTGE